SFSDWIKWLLSLQDVEEKITNYSTQPNSNPSSTNDYIQSRAFRKLASFSKPAYKNKSPLDLMAGKQVSLGVLALTCLNIPPTTQYKPQFTYIAGIIPAPNQPDMITIKHILRPLLGALLGDMVATHKVAGFSSHSGKKPFSWCQVSNTQLAEMKISHLRNRIATLATSRDWLKADQTKRKELVKKSGVWSSELKRLPYWDPVNSVVLGVMHNWFEGVLQHHFWFRWGLNGTPALGGSEEGNDLLESDYYTTENNSNGEGPIVSNFWSDTMKNRLIGAILEVIVPAGITRMPKGFGKAKNGKLKASEWHTLYLIYLPMCSLNIFIGRDVEESLIRNEDAINNICALKCKTNANPKHMGVTIMNKFCQLQRLMAQGGLDCAKETNDKITRGMEFDMDETVYEDILKICQRLLPDLRSHCDVPHPKNAKVLFKHAKSVLSAICGGGMRISREPPNNMIEYVSDGQTCFGKVCEIVELKGGVNSVVMKVLPAKEVWRSDGLDGIFHKMNVLHVQLQGHAYVNQSDVVLPVAYCPLPAWTFGILHPSYLIRPLTGLSEALLSTNDDMQIED
ncbi:hypothetical protein VP01_4471g1, partial [Puccinia sorghi]